MNTTVKSISVNLHYPCPFFELIVFYFAAQPLFVVAVEIKWYTATLISLVTFLDKLHVSLVMPDFFAHYLNTRIFFHQFGGELTHFLAVRTLFSIEFI